MKRHAQKIYQLIAPHIHTPYAALYLALLCLLETLLFVPVDPVVAFYAVERKKDAYKFALVAAIGSVVSALIGYALGDLLWDTVGQAVINFFGIHRGFEQFVLHYQSHQLSTLLLGALLPLPFKLITISAGFCQLPLTIFAGAIFAARTIRFQLVAYASSHWSEQITTFIDRSFNHLVALLILKLALLAAGSYYFFS